VDRGKRREAADYPEIVKTEKQERRPIDRADLAMHSKQPAPEGAPRAMVEIPIKFRCVCPSLPAWARPCGGCRWSKNREG
jgi:hypothetical protein